MERTEERLINSPFTDTPTFTSTEGLVNRDAPQQVSLVSRKSSLKVKEEDEQRINPCDSRYPGV